MIPANKIPWLDRLLYRYVRGELRRAFQGIYVRGLDVLHQLPPDRPVLAYVNHTNWWDLYLVFRLTRECRGKEAFGMMEEKQLAPYRFFTWLGAFSVDLSAPGKAWAGLRYALKVLREPRNMLWIFPQGEVRPPDEAVVARPGLDFLAAKSPQALLVPLAFRVEFFRDDRPVVLMAVGEPVTEPSSAIPRLQALCEDLREAAQRRSVAGFTCLQAPRLTINKRWEWVLCALRGRLHAFNPDN